MTVTGPVTISPSLFIGPSEWQSTSPMEVTQTFFLAKIWWVAPVMSLLI